MYCLILKFLLESNQLGHLKQTTTYKNVICELHSDHKETIYIKYTKENEKEI